MVNIYDFLKKLEFFCSLATKTNGVAIEQRILLESNPSNSPYLGEK
jgi:hypothetical protein